jgi:hypothetical protein
MWREETRRLIEKAFRDVLAFESALPQLSSADDPRILAEHISLVSKVLADQLWRSKYELTPCQRWGSLLDDD